MSPYTIVLCKIDSCSCKKAARKSAKTVGKDSSGESGGLHCLYRQKDSWKLVKLPFLELHALAVHSNALLYFTDLPVSSVFIVARPGFIIQYDTVQAPCNTLVQ